MVNWKYKCFVTKLLELGIYVSMSMAYLEKNCDFKIIYIYIYIYIYTSEN
jgi:hypothetical protein